MNVHVEIYHRQGVGGVRLLDVPLAGDQDIQVVRRRTAEKLEEFRMKQLGAGDVEPKVFSYHWGDNGTLYIDSSTYSDPSTLEQLSYYVQAALRGEPVEAPNFAAPVRRQPWTRRSIQRFRAR